MVISPMCYFREMTEPQKYQRCMVLAGGGFRFGIYLGMYAALCEAGRAPDLLLASCGGAIAATVIASLPDDAARKAWLSSPEMYAFWCGLKSSRQAALVRTLAQAARRKLSRSNAATIPDLFQDYLFEIPQHLPLPPAPAPGTGPAVAIIGGKLLFSESEVGQPRQGRKLFAETVFCDERSAALLQGMPSPLADARWGDHAISEQLLTDVSVPLAVAARISIADMVYFRCHQHQEHHYIGGVLDLFPLEVARRLAGQVVMEFKEEFDQTFSIPAWRAVLGLDGNRRLRHANGQPVEIRIDSSDVSTALTAQPAQKRLDWRRNRIELLMPASHADYVAQIEAQWSYGYERAMEACRRTAPHEERLMRRAGRHNSERLA